MSELTKEKIYKKELEKVGGEGNNNLERIRSLAGGVAFEDIVDKNGNKRFVEGNGTPATIEGFTSTYCKWSLSGTHLMIVLAGNIADTTAISQNSSLATFDLPNYIKNKIVSTFRELVNRQQVTFYNDDYSQQSITINLLKKTSNIAIETGGAFTASKDRLFRIQFDLLIDSE